MAIAQVVAGARILISDLNAYYSLLKGAAGESLTNIYNAAGAQIFQPSSDPAVTTQLVQIKNNAGTTKSALTAGGGALFSNPVLQAQSTTITSASPDLSAATGNLAHISGTTTITSFGTVQAGTEMTLVFDGACQVTYNATSMILQAAANFTSAAGDVLTMVSEGSGNWREKSRRLVASSAVSLTTASNDLSGSVTMTNANQFYDGPSFSLVAGTWHVTGTVHIDDTTSLGGNTTAKLWDGTTVAASAAGAWPAGANMSLSMSAILVLGSTTTYKISVACTQTGHTIKAAAISNGAGNNASHLRAIKVA